MTSSTQNPFFQKSLVNTNPHSKFAVPMAFGLEVKLGGIFAYPRLRCFGQIVRQPFYTRLCNGVHEKNQHHFVTKDITVAMKAFIR